MSRNKEGFTLIELMVVVVIIGILVAIAIPNFVRIVTQAKEAEVRANMHTTQLEVEMYGVEHNGMYPPTVDSIMDMFPENIINPFNLSAAFVQDEGEADIEGVVEYATSAPYDQYLITGLGRGPTLLNITLSAGLIK
jgi:prepilin-type N-terminal cleavage/methylation domain-containing protein